MPCLRANSGLVKPGDVGRSSSSSSKFLFYTNSQTNHPSFLASYTSFIYLFFFVIVFAESCRENRRTCGQFDYPLELIY